MNRILVVDDDANLLAGIKEVLGDAGYDVATAPRAEIALELLGRQNFDLMILDLRMPGMDGLEALGEVRRLRPRLPVIVVTGHGTMETAIQATKQGAFDYHVKPLDPADLLCTVRRALESATLMQGALAVGADAALAPQPAMIGQGPAMQELFKTIGRVAPTNATVLIRGESGTGKELVAKAIYDHSARSQAPLVVVNCVAIPETLLESELFGHERGAFTGAAHRRIGRFEQAHGGTIFLDEIGDIPPSIQSKLLRVLQEKSFQRLGSNATLTTDVRLLAATNRDLEKAVREGRFREDLYHRLNVVTVWVPPLRERLEDIPALAEFFVTRFAQEMRIPRPAVAPQAIRRLQEYSWPGNVRELEHCIQRAMIFTRGYSIQAADLTLPTAAPDRPQSAERGAYLEQLHGCVARYLAVRSGSGTLREFLDLAEKLLLTEALRRTQGHRTRAARLLGIPRPTLHARLQKHGLGGQRTE